MCRRAGSILYPLSTPHNHLCTHIRGSTNHYPSILLLPSYYRFGDPHAGSDILNQDPCARLIITKLYQDEKRRQTGGKMLEIWTALGIFDSAFSFYQGALHLWRTQSTWILPSFNRFLNLSSHLCWQDMIMSSKENLLWFFYASEVLSHSNWIKDVRCEHSKFLFYW